MNIIDGFDKLTLLNYPDKVACTIFTKGCNFRCPYCHNSSLISLDKENDKYKEVISYLNKRKGILDGVCITGGEPLIHKCIKDLIKEIKDMGFLVKLDTNGSNPLMLKEIIDEKLIDYVAMDIKNTFDKYEMTIGCKTNLDNIKKSIDVIESSDIDYEFRTTIVKEFHTFDDIKGIVNMLDEKSKYYIQNFRNSDGVLNKKLNGFKIEELENLQKEIKNKNVYFRDL